MTRSMTAFGRLSKEIEGRKYSLEISSYNRKSLEVNAFFPKELSFLEAPIRKKIVENTSRGQISFRLTLEKGERRMLTKEKCHCVHKNLLQIAKELDPSYVVSFDTVISVASEEEVGFEDKGLLQEEVEKALEKLLPLWVAMKEREGAFLQKTIEESLSLLRKNLEEIQTLLPSIEKKIQNTLLEKVKLLKSVTQEDKEYLLREVAFYLEKMDVSEEVVRINAHIKELSALLVDSTKLVKGRMIDFLVQELLREVNTMCSKAGEIKVVQKALLMKQEIEKIREQGQNIE